MRVPFAPSTRSILRVTRFLVLLGLEVLPNSPNRIVKLWCARSRRTDASHWVSSLLLSIMPDHHLMITSQQEPSNEPSMKLDISQESAFENLGWMRSTGKNILPSLKMLLIIQSMIGRMSFGVMKARTHFGLLMGQCMYGAPQREVWYQLYSCFTTKSF